MLADCRHRGPRRLHGFLLALLLATAQAAAGADQAGVPTPRPRPPTTGRRSGGDSPFRLKSFAGTSFDAASLEQPGCPIAVSVTHLDRNERGVTISLEMSNLDEAPVTRQILGLWVLVPDGTVRGYQRYVGKQEIVPTKYRSVDVTIRTTTVFPDDVIMVALQEATGPGLSWRRDQKELEREIRSLIAP